MGKNKKTEEEFREKLDKKEYEVLRNKGTEKPFSGKYWDTDKEGVYLCKACGNKLFSSLSKFKSKSGWPSFTEPVNKGNIKLQEDRSHGMKRTEVLCGHCGSHLGHVFDDTPKKKGKRYCINSICLNLEKNEK